MERFWVKFKQNSYPLPYISRTYLVWEFLDSELSLKRVQWSIIFFTYLFPIRHLVPIFHSSYLVTPIVNLTYDNHTPKWLTHPSHLLYIPLTCTYPFKTLHFTFWQTLFKPRNNSSISLFCVNSFEILKYLLKNSYKKNKQKKKKRKRQGKTKKEKERNRRSEKKENKLEEYLLFFYHHLYHFHISLSSITIHIIWELNYHKWYLLCF